MPCSACPCGTRAAIRVLIERGPLLDHDRQKVVCAAITVSTDTVRLLGPPTSMSGAYGTEENTASIYVRRAGAVSSIPEQWLCRSPCPVRGAPVATLFAPTRRWLCRRCFAMSIVVRGARPHMDAGRVSVARPVSAGTAAVGLKLVDDVKRLLERAERVLLEESDVDVE